MRISKVPAILERYEVLQALRNELRTQQKANRDAFTTLATLKKQLEDIVYKGRYWVESIHQAEEGNHTYISQSSYFTHDFSGVPTSEILLYARILGQNSGPPEDWHGVTPLPAMFGPPCLEGNDIKTMMTAGAAQISSQDDLSKVCS